MRRLLLTCLIFLAIVFVLPVLSTFPQFSSALTMAEKASVIVSKTNLYSLADFSSPKVTITDEEEQIVTIVLRHGDLVDAIEEDGDFIKVKTEKEIEGYIYKYYLTQNQASQIYPFFNASIRRDSTIYDVNKEASTFQAKKDQRAYIYEGFNDKEEFTAIQIVLEDGSLYNGYVHTTDIQPDGVNKALVVAITIIVAAVTIILAIVFIRKKPKKNRK